jgi:hypothetical protein
MAVKLETFDMTDFINLTFCCQEATVITDFSDLEKIGRNHLITINGGAISAELVEHSFDSIKELNKMCEAISALDHGNRWKLDAVVDMAQPENEVEQEFRMGGF